jgi:hypothetical protein
MPLKIVGVTHIIDEAQWANRLHEDFEPEIVVSTRVYSVGALRLLAVGVEPSLNRPIICRKTRSKSVQDRGAKVKDIEVLREGSIYFRYAGQTRAIAYSELAAMLADQERKRIQTVMQTLKVTEEVGMETAGVVNGEKPSALRPIFESPEAGVSVVTSIENAAQSNSVEGASPNKTYFVPEVRLDESSDHSSMLNPVTLRLSYPDSCNLRFSRREASRHDQHYG